MVTVTSRIGTSFATRMNKSFGLLLLCALALLTSLLSLWQVHSLSAQMAAWDLHNKSTAVSPPTAANQAQDELQQLQRQIKDLQQKLALLQAPGAIDNIAVPTKPATTPEQLQRNKEGLQFVENIVAQGRLSISDADQFRAQLAMMDRSTQAQALSRLTVAINKGMVKPEQIPPF